MKKSIEQCEGRPTIARVKVTVKLRAHVRFDLINFFYFFFSIAQFKMGYLGGLLKTQFVVVSLTSRLA